MKIAFIKNKAEQCIVHQFGKNVYDALKTHSSHDVKYFTLDSETAFCKSAMPSLTIAACDLTLCNFPPLTK